MEPAVPAQPAESSAASTPVEVVYTLTREDYVAWWSHQFDRAAQDSDRRGYPLSARLALVALHLLLAFVIVWDLWFWSTGLGPSEKDEGLEFLAFLWVPFLFGEILLLLGTGPNNLLRRWGGRRKRKAHERQMAAVTAPEKTIWVSLLPRHFIEITRERHIAPSMVVELQTETTVAWSAVQRIDITEQRAFFIVTPGNRALILPRRAFPDVVSFDHFVTTANAYHRMAPVAPGAGGLPRPTDDRITRPPGIQTTPP
jgi:hypothetical protein